LYTSRQENIINDVIIDIGVNCWKEYCDNNFFECK
jgi:hypothetical protein